jgi:hypothetical protein
MIGKLSIIAVIIAEGIGIGYFGGYLYALAWFVFWLIMALWNNAEMMMRRHNGAS